MKKIILGYLLILITFSCREEKLGFIQQQNVENEKAALFVQLLPIANRYSVDATQKTILAGSNKTYLEIPAAAFVDKNGNAIKETITLDILSINKPSDIIRCNSNSIHNGSVIRPLLQFNIDAKIGDNKVFLADDKHIKILVATDNPSSLSNIYFGQVTKDKGIKWEEDTNKDHLVLSTWETATGNVSGFEMTIDKLGWISLQTPISDYDKAPLSIELPNEFNATNTAIFAIYKSTNAVIPLYDDPNQHGFYSSQVPKNEDLSVFIISKQGNNEYFFLKWDTNLKESSSLRLEPKMVTFSEMIQLLEE